MTRDEYNECIIRVQTNFPFLEHRFRTEYRQDFKQDPKLILATFEVYYGKWIQLGTQFNPFSLESTYQWYSENELKLSAEIGRDASR